MKANQAFVNNEEAVSPVIGVILMVAITVVLAAVVFVLVSDLGGDAGVPQFPSADAEDATGSNAVDDLNANPADDETSGQEAYVTLEHRGGDSIEVADYTWTVGGRDVALFTTLSVDGECSVAAGTWSVGQTIHLCEATAAATALTGSQEVIAIHEDSETIVFETTVTIA